MTNFLIFLFQLKPYVPYTAPAIYQSKFTAKDLFDTCYGPEIEKDFKEGKLRVESSEEKLEIAEQDTKEKKDGS